MPETIQDKILQMQGDFSAYDIMDQLKVCKTTAHKAIRVMVRWDKIFLVTDKKGEGLPLKIYSCIEREFEKGPKYIKPYKTKYKQKVSKVYIPVDPLKLMARPI